MPALNDDQFRLLMRNDRRHVATTQRRCASDLGQLAIEEKEFSIRFSTIMSQAATLCDEEKASASHGGGNGSRGSHIAKRAGLFKEILTRRWEQFRVGPAFYLLPAPVAIARCDETVQAAWRHFRQRVEEELPKQIAECLAVLDRLVERNQRLEET